MESRSFRRIQGGDAAKAAEDSTQDPAAYQGSFGMNLRASRGARFELDKDPHDQGEARPLSSSDSVRQASPVASEEQPGEDSAGITKKLFRKLFRP